MHKVFLVLILLPGIASAIPLLTPISSSNQHQFIAIDAFDSYGVRGACYFPSSNEVYIGQIEGSQFLFLGPYINELTNRIRKLEQQRFRLRRSRWRWARSRAKGPVSSELRTLQKILDDINRGVQTCLDLFHQGAHLPKTTPAPTLPPTPPGPPSNPIPPTPTPPNPPTPPTSSIPIPELARWEAQMISFGAQNCSFLQSGAAFDPKLAATYYDAQWVFYQIAEYTGDSRWIDCAEVAESVYRDSYAMPNNGLVPGYWNFTHGLTLDYLRTGDAYSKQAVLMIAHNAAYSQDGTPLSSTASTDYSREVAYAIMGYLNAEAVGDGTRARLTALVNQAFDHMDQWFVRRTAPYVRPFMVGLTAHALIMYHQKTGDPRVISTLTNALDQIWDLTWLQSAEAFQYTDHGDTSPAPDLNLLIAPAYAWLYRQTGAVRFRERGDQIFAGGVRHAWLNGGKQFNQNYRWSFEFVRLRR